MTVSSRPYNNNEKESNLFRNILIGSGLLGAGSLLAYAMTRSKSPKKAVQAVSKVEKPDTSSFIEPVTDKVIPKSLQEGKEFKPILDTWYPIPVVPSEETKHIFSNPLFNTSQASSTFSKIANNRSRLWKIWTSSPETASIPLSMTKVLNSGLNLRDIEIEPLYKRRLKLIKPRINQTELVNLYKKLGFIESSPFANVGVSIVGLPNNVNITSIAVPEKVLKTKKTSLSPNSRDILSTLGIDPNIYDRSQLVKILNERYQNDSDDIKETIRKLMLSDRYFTLRDYPLPERRKVGQIISDMSDFYRVYNSFDPQVLKEVKSLVDKLEEAALNNPSIDRLSLYRQLLPSSSFGQRIEAAKRSRLLSESDLITAMRTAINHRYPSRFTSSGRRIIADPQYGYVTLFSSI